LWHSARQWIQAGSAPVDINDVPPRMLLLADGAVTFADEPAAGFLPGPPAFREPVPKEMADSDRYR
jgi:hypothetical protein